MRANRSLVDPKAEQPGPLSEPLPGEIFFSKLTKVTREKLARINVHCAWDLALHLPLRYDDETRCFAIREAPQGEEVVVEAVVLSCEIQYRPRRQLVCQVQDESGVMSCRFFNFYPSQLKVWATGARIRLFGEVRSVYAGLEMLHPRYKVVTPEATLPTSLTPVYPTTAGLGQQSLRQLIVRAMAALDRDDSVPETIRAQYRLPEFCKALDFLHNPPAHASRDALQERTHPAWCRMKFDELLAQQLSMRTHQLRRLAVKAPALMPGQSITAAFLKALPFRLTTAQQKVVAQIQKDLSQPYPMQRLLQGDVGSGKTVVAVLAALQCVENGFQVALMAPTEILAEQHYRKLEAWLKPLAIGVAWISGSTKKKDKQQALEGIANGQIMLVVGTHALFEQAVVFQQLGLAIIDEQHRFGVRQRLALRLKGTESLQRAEGQSLQPHQLMMSATPIPRTLAMSFYADLDVSVIDEIPPGRTPVSTKLVTDQRRDQVIDLVRQACAQGRQVYWVCPLVEELEGAGHDEGDVSTPLAPIASVRQKTQVGRKGPDMSALQAALDTHEKLSQVLPGCCVGLAHGRLKSEEKSAVMKAFLAGEVQLLVATTVIEVGVDVPNASLMVIENAERMGLSQLHQLRGRVGRGAAKSACILLYHTPLSIMARERLKIIFENSDGFEIARHDLRLRGPGELLGARQSGVPMLRFADLTLDVEWLERARDSAQTLLAQYPMAAVKHRQRWLAGRGEFLKV